MVQVDDVLKWLPKVVALYRRVVASLGDAPIDVQRRRELLRRLLEEIQIAPRNGNLVATMALEFQPLVFNRGSGGGIWCP